MRSRREAGGAEEAREKCLRLLERRGRSGAELRRRLREAGFERDVTEAVLGNLEQAGLVNDEEFARAWVAQRVASGRAGRHKLRWELRAKGIDEGLIRRLVEAAVDDETELGQALQLAERRLGDRPRDQLELLRVRRLLLGRGYDFGVVESVMRRLSPRSEDLSDDR